MGRTVIFNTTCPTPYHLGRCQYFTIRVMNLFMVDCIPIRRTDYGQFRWREVILKSRYKGPFCFISGAIRTADCHGVQCIFYHGRIIGQFNFCMFTRRPFFFYQNRSIRCQCIFYTTEPNPFEFSFMQFFR